MLARTPSALRIAPEHDDAFAAMNPPSIIRMPKLVMVIDDHLGRIEGLSRFVGAEHAIERHDRGSACLILLPHINDDVGTYVSNDCVGAALIQGKKDILFTPHRAIATVESTIHRK